MPSLARAGVSLRSTTARGASTSSSASSSGARSRSTPALLSCATTTSPNRSITRPGRPSAWNAITGRVALIAMSGMAEPSVALPRDRLGELQLDVPGEQDPGVLADLGDEGVDQRPPRRLGVDRREVRLGQHLAHDPRGL